MELIKPNQIGIVILNYNCQKFLAPCLKSIFEDFPEARIFVVDNCSIDGSHLAMKKKFPQIELIKNRRNYGFAKGNNIGIKKALRKKADYILLLNPDTIVRKGFFSAMINLMASNEKIGIIGPALESRKNKKHYYALEASLNPLIGRIKHRHYEKLPKHEFKAKLVSGCCLLIRKEVFKSIGFFDQKFFLYFEDSDFCLRAGKAGWQIFCQPKAKVFHHISGCIGDDSRQKIKHNLKSNCLFIKKHIFSLFRPFAYLYLIILAVKTGVKFLCCKLKKGSKND